MTGLTTVNVQTGGAIINPNGFAITVPQALLHDTTSGAPAIDGGLKLLGTGMLTLSGSNTYTGSTAVTGGTLNVTGALAKTASDSVASGAVLEVDGLLNTTATSTVGGVLRGQGSVGAINVQSGGALAPGLSSFSSAAGVLTANGNLSLTDTTSLFSIRLGVATGSDYDELTMNSGNVALNNATLKLILGSAYALQPAGTIDVIINGTPAASTITGEFAQGTSITASNGNTFDIAYGENSTDTGAGHDVLLIATGDPAPPSHELEAASLAFTPAAPSSPAAVFGNQKQLVTVAAVPEPGSWAMLLGGLGALGIFRSVRRRKPGA
jgi:autotransporter-associated beta strand protein